MAVGGLEIPRFTPDAQDSLSGNKNRTNDHMHGEAARSLSERPGANGPDLALIQRNTRNSSKVDDLLRLDGASLQRDKEGNVEKVTKDGVQLDVTYLKDKGQVVTDAQGRPIVQELKITKDGKSQTIDLKKFATAGDYEGERNWYTQLAGENYSPRALDLSTLSVVKDGPQAGKISVLRQEDRAECTFGLAQKADGTFVQRLESIKSPEGQRTFAYDQNDPSKVTGWIDEKDTPYGRFIDKQQRIGDTNNFSHVRTIQRLDENGVLQNVPVEAYTMGNVHITGDGQAFYQIAGTNPDGTPSRDIFENTWAKKNDLEAAKEHLIQVGKGHLFGGSESKLNSCLEKIIDRQHRRDAAGTNHMTDDQLALAFRGIAKSMEIRQEGKSTGAAAKLTNGQFYRAHKEALQVLKSNYVYINQGQVGSCYLHAMINSKHNSLYKLFDPGEDGKKAGAFFGMFTKGKYKGKAFDTSDLTARYGQDAFSHAMGSAAARGIGYRHLSPGYPGTTTDGAQKACKFLFGEKMAPVMSLSWAMSHKKQAIKRLEKTGGGAPIITMGGAHAQTLEVAVNSAGNKVLHEDNTWNLMNERNPKKLF